MTAAIFQWFNWIKGGQDNVHQRITTFTAHTKPSQWNNCSLSYVLHTAPVYATTFFALSQDVEHSSLDFLEISWNLTESQI